MREIAPVDRAVRANQYGRVQIASHAIVRDWLIGTSVFDWLTCRRRPLGCHRQREAAACLAIGVFAPTGYTRISTLPSSPASVVFPRPKVFSRVSSNLKFFAR